MNVGQATEAKLRAALGGRRILLTGHTGFKGGWIALWLHRLGAEVVGVALPPPPGPGFCTAAGVLDLVDSRFADIRNARAYARATRDIDADVLIHMAAQPIVRRSYLEPAETFATNVAGTAVVLEAARRMPSLKAAIVVTSDKCYENEEQVWSYREIDRLGGSDPYSASKAGTELVVASFARSFFAGPGTAALASVRAGNVFGGGDWGEDRLVPDIMRAAAEGGRVRIRNPQAVRPWQHVLEPLLGYLTLAAALLDKGRAFSGPWNLGPADDGAVAVGRLARMVCEALGSHAPHLRMEPSADDFREASVLRLDSAKARARLGWRPRLDLAEAVEMTAAWHLRHMAGDADLRAFSLAQIERFMDERRGLAAELEVAESNGGLE